MSYLCEKAWMSDPKDVSSEATEGWSICVEGMRLCKVVTAVRFSDDRWLVVGLCSSLSNCDYLTDCISC